MHAVQSAMAVRREREKREQRRQSQIRRSSSKSPRASDASHASADHSAGQLATDENPIEKAPNPAESSMTAFHLGVVFILLGFLMVFSAMITNSMTGNNNWSSLLGVGVTFIIVGLIMVMVNRIISAREEEELAKYVSQKLARTRSGYQIGNRDVEANAASNTDQPIEQPLSTQLQPPIQPQFRRAMSTRVHGNVNRKASTRRSMRIKSESEALKSSNSTQSHLSVKNGSNGGSANAVDKDNKTENDQVLVTETETLLPKQDNKPALVVTKESRRPSKRVKKPPEEPKS